MPTHTSFPMLAPEQFAILPWGVTPGEPALLEEIKQCGFNLAGFVAPGALDAVEQAGLKGIVFDETIHVSDAWAELDEAEITQRVKVIASRVKDHPGCFGYYLRDEPLAATFPALGRWVRALRAADPAARPYINLFPNYATPQQLGASTYQEYIDSFLSTVAPPFLSYDHYALMEDGTLRDGYFQNLETVRAASRRCGIPFWNIVLANAHYYYAEPSPAGLRFQAYTTLAYGAGGLSYYTYFTPDMGNFRQAPIDPFGDKTPTWGMLRQVNRQIHGLGEIYVTLKHLNVFHHPDSPVGCSRIENSQLFDSVAGGSFVIGEFVSSDGKPYGLVVNKDLNRSVHLSVKFKTAGKVLWTNPYSRVTQPVDDDNNWLAPGQGVLLSLATRHGKEGSDDMASTTQG